MKHTAFCIATAMCVAVLAVQAKTIDVAVGDSIANAIAAAETDDVVQLAAGTHYVPAQITIDKGITVRGVRASATIIRPSAVGVKLFLLKHADAVLSDVTLTGVSAGGFCVVEINAPGGTLQDAIITDNSATGTGNGNACVGTRDKGGVIRRCKFTDNTSTSAYGTLQIYGSPRVESCLFTGNKATWGAGIYMQVSANPFMTHVTAYGNTSTSDTSHDDFYDYTGGAAKLIYNCCFAEAYRNSGSVYTGCHFGEPTEENLKGKGVVVDGDATVDLDGVAFDPEAPSIGCYAFRDDVVTVEWNSGVEVIAGEEFTASPIVSNLPEGASVAFDLYDAFGAWAGGSATGEAFTFTAPNHGGWCTLVTTITEQGGTVNTITLQSVLFIGVLDVQVTKSGTGDSMTDIVAAVGVCASGATVTVHDGEYVLSQTVTLDKPLTIRSVNGRDTVTLKSADPANKTIVVLNHPDAKVDGLTFTGNTGTPAVSIRPNGGTVDNSAFVQNLGGGSGTALTTESPTAVVRRTIFTRNKGNWGSVYVKNGGLFDSCLFYGNQASYGGGVYIEQNYGSALSEQTRFLNCTFYDNEAKNLQCADLYDFRGGNIFVNTILTDANIDAGNGAFATNCVIVGGKLKYQASVNISTVAPVFADAANGNYLPAAGSPLIDGGAALESLAATDVYGRSRVSGEAIDIGAAEVPLDNLAVDLSCDFARCPFREGLSATVVPAVVGGAGATLAWTVTRHDGVVAAAVETGVEPFVFAIPGPGAYSVHVVATLGDQAATNDCANTIVAGAQELFVDENGGNVYPFATPETAARDFNLAWAMVCSGSVVHVAAGRYETAKSLDLTDPIQLIGAGRDATVIRLKPGENGRVALVDNAESVIRGCTLTGGRLGFPEGQLGVGVKFGDRGGLVEDCHITDNSFDTVMQHGAVAFSGKSRGCIRQSVIDFNTTKGYGGGIHFSGVNGGGGSVVDCLVCSNSAAYGGGAYFTGVGSMTNCTLAANKAGNDNNGHEIIFYNGFPGSRFVNSAIKPNNNAADGWNSFYLALQTGGTNGIEKVLVHSALASYYGESAEIGEDGKKIRKTLMPPPESGNLAMVPTFVDDAHGNYRLPASSPLRDGGLYEPWMREIADIDGQPLAIPDQAPIGCYAKPKKGMSVWVK